MRFRYTAFVIFLLWTLPVLAQVGAAPLPRCLLPHDTFLPGILGNKAGPGGEVRRGAADKHQVDFNGDGCADLAVGAHHSDVLGTKRAGYVQVFYGSLSGLSGEGQLVRPPSPYQDGRFGSEIAAGDFNNDGYTDLAVGAPGQLVSGEPGAGAVYVFPGSASGIDPENWSEWHQDTAGVPGGAEAADGFGQVMVAGDFQGDGFQDLALGIPNESIGSTARAGFLIILRGSADGITSFASEEFRVSDHVLEEGLRFGYALAVGNFSPGAEDDLAVSLPGRDRLVAPFIEATDAGQVTILRGSPNGLNWDLTIDQSYYGVPGAPEDNDEFGHSLAGGDFNNNGKDDLAVGVPREDVNFQQNAGRVVVFYDISTQRNKADAQDWYQGKDDIPFANEAYDWFGASLGSGDFNNDGYADLLIGVPLEDITSIDDAGAVGVLYGTSSGLSGAHAQAWTAVRSPRAGEKMGENVTTGDYNGDGFTDFASGLHGWKDSQGASRGYVLVFNGSANRLTQSGYRELFPAAPSNIASAKYFGWTVR